MVVIGKLISICALLLVGGCDQVKDLTGQPASKEFGVSYDDCILGKLNSGLSGEAVAAVRAACKRVWETPGDEPVSTSARLHAGIETPYVEFFFENPGQNIGTQAEVSLKFQTDSEDETLTWTFPVFVEPGETDTSTGTFQGKEMPSVHFEIAESKFTRVIPIVKANSE